MQGSGREAIDALIAGVQQRFPDGRFRLRGTPDAHNDRLRFSWALDLGDAVAEGTDFATLAADGKLRSVTGFLDRMPG